MVVIAEEVPEAAGAMLLDISALRALKLKEFLKDLLDTQAGWHADAWCTH